MTGLMNSLTEHKHATVFQMANCDPVTGLVNRELFTDRLTQVLSHAARGGEWVGVLSIDVDHLTGINDQFGRAAGDLLLRSMADRFTSTTRTEDTVARLGSDEFAVILPDLQDAGDGDVVARKLLATLRDPHVLDGHTVTVSCSVGIAVFPADASTQAELVRAAAAAAHHARQLWNTCQRYSRGLKRSVPGAVEEAQVGVMSGTIE
jgi:diguanylate cyclase (GGDEF)-like protein